MRTLDVMCHGNQAALDLVDGTGFAHSAIAVEGRGDVAVSDNQVQANLSHGALYATVWARGQTSGMTGNAIFETLAHVGRSGYAAGLVLASATGNRSAHCIQVNAPDSLNQSNLVIGGNDCTPTYTKHAMVPAIYLFVNS